MRPHLLVAAAPLVAAADQLRVYTDDTHTYAYYGCYNETTLAEGSAGTRALAGGSSLVQPDNMTVPACLRFCHDGDTKYRYAGVEWSRECWCAQNIAGIAQKLDDAECNFACAGNKTQACGGHLKLNVYRMSGAERSGAALGVGAVLALVCVHLAVLF
ncbi:Carbohydrate-binding WSC [Cordyceps militaris CM01]|uniref:Carbohydrate-binding WSC n=2 Tax=Cordyceps militaris TaxID=73501 RepID=G3JHQ1_CORMM|nr:Carbohydrate-binding WSC [Cordyceps militaris CM01]ATY58354.1 Carbohydrate-binding WSC [Cordyceps militaris]EGX91757.1 Carbohydrate-binding WSC [Cordyceps militaris CM01]